jgi:hypothetical protein
LFLDLTLLLAKTTAALKAAACFGVFAAPLASSALIGSAQASDFGAANGAHQQISY